jgi:2-polyprenyl-6-methoxyphenol hydroxylase-like FAD-dependent oxidoreductase
MQIIGAGPAGLLLAHYLLRRGKYRVEIYEQRADMRLVDASQDRTFPISLQERGRKAIREIAGLDEAIASASVFCNGTKVYRKRGKARKIPRAIPIMSIDRNRLVMILLQHLTQTYTAEQLIVKFDCPCIQVDRKAKTVTMQPEQGEAFSLAYDRFHEGDSVLLIGDAAHAVSPSIGQGCNASLEDVLVFERLLEQHEDDWLLALPAFTQQRVPDAHALKELSDYSFPRTKGLVVEFFLRLTLSRLLHRWFPQQVKPFVFDLVLDQDLSYSQVLSLSQGWINKVKRSLVADR